MRKDPKDLGLRVGLGDMTRLRGGPTVGDKDRTVTGLEPDRNGGGKHGPEGGYSPIVPSH